MPTERNTRAFLCECISVMRHMRLEFLITVSVNYAVFWAATQCN
jgi:hypothetical protein